jgi:hypothetical protein
MSAGELIALQTMTNVTSPIYRTRSIERRLAGVLLTVP